MDNTLVSDKSPETIYSPSDNRNQDRRFSREKKNQIISIFFFFLFNSIRYTEHALAGVLVGLWISRLGVERLITDEMPPHRCQFLIGAHQFRFVVAKNRIVFVRFARVAAILIHSGNRHTRVWYYFRQSVVLQDVVIYSFGKKPVLIRSNQQRERKNIQFLLNLFFKLLLTFSNFLQFWRIDSHRS